MPPVFQGDGHAPVFQGGGAVNAQVLHAALIGAPPAPAQVGLQQVQELGHGGEEEHAVARRMELDQHAIQDLELAAAPHEHRRVVVVGGRVAQARVVAHLHTCATMSLCLRLQRLHYISRWAPQSHRGAAYRR